MQSWDAARVHRAFNRTSMESKRISTSEAGWKLDLLAFNRTSMESKHLLTAIASGLGGDALLIEPVWNRNLEHLRCRCTFQRLGTFNRTSMESKLVTYSDGDDAPETRLLIEPVWNRNTVSEAVSTDNR